MKRLGVLLLAVVILGGTAWAWMAYNDRVAEATDRDLSVPTPTVSATAVDARLEAVFTGDSVTQADTASFASRSGANSWVRYVVEDPGSPWTQTANTAVAGQTTRAIADRFEDDVLALEPEAVVLMAGTNDIGQQIPLAESMGNVEEMVSEALARGVKVWMVSPPPSDGEPDLAAEFAAAQKALAERLGVPFVNVHDALVAGDGGYRGGLSDDGIHPNEAGAREIADVVLGEVVVTPTSR